MGFQFASVLTHAIYLCEKVEFQAHSAFDFHVYLAVKRYRYGELFHFEHKGVDLSRGSPTLFTLY